jgi:hypothetical protein
MGTPAILERYPRTDDDARLAAFDIELQMNLFIFDRATQPFDENIVHEAAASVHRNRGSRGFEFAGERGAGELRALVGVEESSSPSEAKA